MPGGSGQNYIANPCQTRVQALPQSNLCLRPLTLDYYCCGHWICREVPGRITPQLKSNLVSKASVRLLITYVSYKSKFPTLHINKHMPKFEITCPLIYVPNSSQFTYVQFLPIYMYAKFMPFYPYQVLAKNYMYQVSCPNKPKS